MPIAPGALLNPMHQVWLWVAIPFPVSDPYKDNPFPDIPTWPKRPSDDNNGTAIDPGQTLPLDVNFYFFLVWYACFS